MSDYILTFEINSNKDVLEIHGTRDGLQNLKERIENLLEKGRDHVHMMTPSWGGRELTEGLQCDENNIINHVKIYKW